MATATIGRHPLDPGVDAGPQCVQGCVENPIEHCHCERHDGVVGCRWGTQKFILRLVTELAKAQRELYPQEMADLIRIVINGVHDLSMEGFCIPHDAIEKRAAVIAQDVWNRFRLTPRE